MKKIQMENILKSKGYVSIEALIVAGLIITSGSFMVSKLAWKGKDISVKSNNSLNLSKKVLDDNNYSSNANKIINTSKGTDLVIPKNIVQANKIVSVNPSIFYSRSNPIIDSLTDVGIKDGFIYGTINPPNFGEITAPFEEGTIGIIGYVGTDTTVKIPSEINGKPVTCVLTGFQEETLKSNNAKTTIKNNEELLKYLDKNIDLESNERLDEKDVKNCITYINQHKELLFMKEQDKKLPSELSFMNRPPIGPNYKPPTKEQIKQYKEFKKSRPITFKVHEFKMKYMDVIPEGNFHIKKVVFPDTVKVIHEDSFRGLYDDKNNMTCKGQIEEIVLGKNLKVICSRAFIGNRISKVTVPKEISKLEIRNHAFLGNELTSNETLKLLSRMQFIGSDLFRYNNLTDLEIPNNIKSIARGAFCNNKIKNVIVPKDCSISENNEYGDDSFDKNVKVTKK